MGKNLLYIAIGLTFVSAILGFLNRGKLADARTQAADLSAKLANVEAGSTKITSEVGTLKTQVTELTTAKEQATAALENAKTGAEKANQQAQELQKQMGEKDTQISQLDTDNKAKQAKIDELLANTTKQADPSEALTTELSEAKQAAQMAMDKLKSIQDENKVLKERETGRITRTMRDGLEGTILAINPAWNFVILSLGDRNGVVNNSEMLIKRGVQLVGKVRVTSVEPSSSIADIIANSVPKGVSIQPGDKVIYQSASDSDSQ